MVLKQLHIRIELLRIKNNLDRTGKPRFSEDLYDKTGLKQCRYYNKNGN